jgi:hypothetical protein
LVHFVSLGVSACKHSPYVHHREAVEFYGLLYFFGKIFAVAGAPGDKRSACSPYKLGRIHRALESVQETGADNGLGRRCKRALSSGHSVIEIIKDQQRQIDIAAAGCGQMGTTDTQPAVSHGYYYCEVRLGQLDAGCVSKRTAMESVESVGVEEGVEKSGTAYVAYESHLVSLQPHGLKSPVKRLGDRVV